jgi:hypothetical protein
VLKENAMVTTGKKIAEMLNHPEWHHEMCCDSEAHPMHEVCIDIEFTKEERRAFDFPSSCAKVQVTPDLLERICRAPTKAR